MSQVTSIREQWSEGKTISEIARAVSVDRNTVYKYTQMADFSKAVVLKGGADKFLDLRLKEEDSPIPRQILYLPNQYTQNTRQSASLFPEQHSPSTLLVMKTYNQLP